MTATFAMTMWVAGAAVLLVTMVGMNVWYRRRSVRPLDGYQGLKKLTWTILLARMSIVLFSLGVAIGVALGVPRYKGVLVAPSIWALIVIVGLVVLDLVVMGRQSTTRVRRKLTAILPARLLLQTVVYAIGLVAACMYLGTMSTDGHSYSIAWMKDGVVENATKTPFPGSAFTDPLFRFLVVLILVSITGIVLTALRPAYLPDDDYALLDRSFRRRTIRDIIITCLGAVSMSLSLVAADMAWAIASIGPESLVRVAYAVSGIVVALWMLTTACWSLVSLLFLPRPEEDWREQYERA